MNMYTLKKVAVILIIILSWSCSKEKLSDRAAVKVQEFVENISAYAKKYNSNFIIIPQNGPELAYKNISPDEGIDEAYINAINGFGIEELFFNGTYSPDNERIDMLKQLAAYKPVLVSEYVKDDSQIGTAFEKNENNGFICFVRDKNNYHYSTIPDSVHNLNTSNINKLEDVKMIK